MKISIILLSLLSFCHAGIFGQTQTDKGASLKNANVGIGLGMGEEIAVNLFATATFSNQFYGGLHYLATSTHSNGVREDYIRGVRFFTNSTRIPRDHFASHSIMIGKNFQKQTTPFSISFETGVSWIIYSKALFSRSRQTPGFLGPQGDFDGYETYNKTGLLLNGKISYRIANDFHVELSTYGSINSIRSIIVENLTFVFDLYLKNSKKVKTQKASIQQ